MKSAVPAVAPAVGRRVSRPGKSGASASGRKSVARRSRNIPPEESLAHLPDLFRALWHPEFMKYGRPEDYGELREALKERK